MCYLFFYWYDLVRDGEQFCTGGLDTTDYQYGQLRKKQKTKIGVLGITPWTPFLIMRQVIPTI